MLRVVVVRVLRVLLVVCRGVILRLLVVVVLVVVDFVGVVVVVVLLVVVVCVVVADFGAAVGAFVVNVKDFAAVEFAVVFGPVVASSSESGFVETSSAATDPVVSFWNSTRSTVVELSSLNGIV